jgi:hypothetical protein
MGFAIRNSVRGTLALFRRFIVFSIRPDRLVGYRAAFSKRNRSLCLYSEPLCRALEHGFGGDRRDDLTPAIFATIAPKQAASLAEACHPARPNTIPLFFTGMAFWTIVGVLVYVVLHK